MWIPEVDDRENETWATENDVVYEAYADGLSFGANVLEEDIGSTERRHAVMLGRELHVGEFLALGGDGERAVGILQQRAKIEEGGEDDSNGNGNGNGNKGSSGVDSSKHLSKAAAIAFFSGLSKKKGESKKKVEEGGDEDEEEKEIEKKEENNVHRRKETFYERYMRIKAELEEVKSALGEQQSGEATPMTACVEEISERLERMPDAILSQIHDENDDENDEVVEEEEVNKNDVNEGNDDKETDENEEKSIDDDSDNDTLTMGAIMKIVRAVDKKLREVEESVGLPNEGDAAGGARSCGDVRMPDVNALFVHLMSLTRAQTERLRGRLAHAQAVLANTNTNMNMNSEEKDEGAGADREMIEHLHEQIADWETTMSALPLIAERLRSLCPVEECARSASGDVDRILGEQYQAVEGLREVRSVLGEVEARLGENRAVIESNIQYIDELISSSSSSHTNNDDDNNNNDNDGDNNNIEE